MKRNSRKFLILSGLFLFLSIILLAIEMFNVVRLIDFSMRVEEPLNTVDSFFVSLSLTWSLLLCIATALASGGSIPFISVFLKREGRKWYAILMISLAIVIILTAIISMISVPIAISNRPEVSSSSSSAY